MKKFIVSSLVMSLIAFSLLIGVFEINANATCYGILFHQSSSPLDISEDCNSSPSGFSYDFNTGKLYVPSNININGNDLLPLSGSLPVYDQTGNLQSNAHVVIIQNLLVPVGPTNFNFTGSAIFTNNTSYSCTAMNAINNNYDIINIVYNSGSQISLRNNNGMGSRWSLICIGN